jgi:legumain
MNKFLFLCLLATISCANWGVLVAGSNTYSNYRHQSDIFHAYHILRNNGIPESNIITFAYDDIANNRRNPFPGLVFNKPDGEDVYAGVVIDYSGSNVTPAKFVAAITGDAETAGGKVLQSTSEDNVFIYFSDHGGVGLIAFPSEYLYADKLNAALQTMYDKKMYKRLVFYLEACESGSMFNEKLPDNINIWATTAANPSESSWAYYCGSEAKVNGTLIGSCLGDEYSVKWMEDTDAADLYKETLQEQYETVKKNTVKSHVQLYGDTSIGSDLLIDYQGQRKSSGFLKKILSYVPGFRSLEENNHVRVNNENMRLYYLKNLAEQTNDLEDQMNFYKEVAAEARVQKIFEIFNKFFKLGKMEDNAKIDFECYRRSVKYYENACGMEIDRDFKFMKHIANFCSSKHSPVQAMHAFNDICKRRF